MSSRSLKIVWVLGAVRFGISGTFPLPFGVYGGDTEEPWEEDTVRRRVLFIRDEMPASA